MLCVTESGLYHLIFNSRKEEAKVFRRWITGEVIPTILKTGSYSIDGINFQDYEQIAHLDLQNDPDLLRQSIHFYEDLMLASSDKRKLLTEIAQENSPQNSFSRRKRTPLNIN